MVVLLPVVFLLWQAGGTRAGGTIWPLIFRSLTWTLLLNTIELDVIVTVCSAVAGVGSAWLIERTNLPLRRFWQAVVVLPLAIPDFVIGYTWLSLTPAVHGLFGASLVMTLGLYPLVYQPVAAALRRVDTSLYEVARSLGLGRFRALFPHLTVHGNVAFGLPRSARHGPFVDELLELVGLSALGGRYPHELSGGSRLRGGAAGRRDHPGWAATGGLLCPCRPIDGQLSRHGEPAARHSSESGCPDRPGMA